MRSPPSTSSAPSEAASRPGRPPRRCAVRGEDRASTRRAARIGTSSGARPFLRPEDARGVGQIGPHVAEHGRGRQAKVRPVSPAVDRRAAAEPDPDARLVLKMREQLTEPAAGGGQRIQPVEPARGRSPWRTRSPPRRPAAAGRARGERRPNGSAARRLLDRATQAVVQAFEKAVAAVAERQQPIARRGQMSGRRERAHRSFEGRRRDQVHEARLSRYGAS